MVGLRASKVSKSRVVCSGALKLARFVVENTSLANVGAFLSKNESSMVDVLLSINAMDIINFLLEGGRTLEQIQTRYNQGVQVRQERADAMCRENGCAVLSAQAAIPLTIPSIDEKLKELEKRLDEARYEMYYTTSLLMSAKLIPKTAEIISTLATSEAIPRKLGMTVCHQFFGILDADKSKQVKALALHTAYMRLFGMLGPELLTKVVASLKPMELIIHFTYTLNVEQRRTVMFNYHRMHLNSDNPFIAIAYLHAESKSRPFSIQAGSYSVYNHFLVTAQTENIHIPAADIYCSDNFYLFGELSQSLSLLACFGESMQYVLRTTNIELLRDFFFYTPEGTAPTPSHEDTSHDTADMDARSDAAMTSADAATPTSTTPPTAPYSASYSAICDVTYKSLFSSATGT